MRCTHWATDDLYTMTEVEEVPYGLEKALTAQHDIWTYSDTTVI